MSSDSNQFVKLEGGKPVADPEGAYIMYVALTRARKKLFLSPAVKAGDNKRPASSDAETPVRARDLNRHGGSHQTSR
jgi:superfamily I DNA/RNA helicase